MENSITVPPELTVIHRLQQIFFSAVIFWGLAEEDFQKPLENLLIMALALYRCTSLTHLGTYLPFSLVFLHLLVTHLHHPF